MSNPTGDMPLTTPDPVFVNSRKDAIAHLFRLAGCSGVVRAVLLAAWLSPEIRSVRFLHDLGRADVGILGHRRSVGGRRRFYDLVLHVEDDGR